MPQLILIVRDTEDEAYTVGVTLMETIPRKDEMIYLALSAEGNILPGVTNNPLAMAIFKVVEVCYYLINMYRVEDWMHPYIDSSTSKVYLYLQPMNEETRLYTRRVILRHEASVTIQRRAAEE